MDPSWEKKDFPEALRVLRAKMLHEETGFLFCGGWRVMTGSPTVDSSELRQFLDTPPKTNMEPENGPLEKEIPIGNHHFQVPCYFLGV